MPKPNLYSMPRKPPVVRTFDYSDEQGSLSIELRALPGVLAYKVGGNTRKLAGRFITGAGMPGGKPVGLPPMGSPPRTIKAEDLSEEFLGQVATVELMQAAAKDDLDNYYTPEDLIALAFDWEAAWWALQVFIRELEADPKPDTDDPKSREPKEAPTPTNGTETAPQSPESTVST